MTSNPDDKPARIRVRLGAAGIAQGANFEVRWQNCNKLFCSACPHGPYVYLLMNRRTALPGTPAPKRQVRRYIPRKNPLYFAVLRAAGVEYPDPRWIRGVRSLPVIRDWEAALLDATVDTLLYTIRMTRPHPRSRKQQ
jgi:hypothetical protein